LVRGRADPTAPLIAVLEGQETALLTDLMEACQQLDGVVALLAAAAPGQAQLAFVAGPGANVDVRPLLSAALAELGGRGGGRHDRAQGAAPVGAERVRAVLAAVAATRASD
jgi:alanyl-tRNA synthetase